jgi:MinD-like ATPase involved in chromosome partitioning or flagellar assembly
MSASPEPEPPETGQRPLRDDGADAEMTRDNIYAEPLRGGRTAPSGPMSKLGSALRGRFAGELKRREWELEEQLASSRPMTRPNIIAVVSPKGGVGKTTVSYLLGNLLASDLHLRTVALDANPDFGTLAALAPDAQRVSRSLADLLAEMGKIDSPAQIHPFVSRLPSGLHILGAPAHAEVMAQLTPGLYARLLGFMERFYEVLILDLGTGITDPLAQFAIQRADQIVVITTPEWITAAGVLGALRYLKLEENRGVLVLNQAQMGRHAGNRAVIEENFRREAIATQTTIPYDERLRMMLDSGTYDVAQLRRGTRVPIKELTAAIAANFV